MFVNRANGKCQIQKDGEDEPKLEHLLSSLDGDSLARYHGTDIEIR